MSHIDQVEQKISTDLAKLRQVIDAQIGVNSAEAAPVDAEGASDNLERISELEQENSELNRQNQIRIRRLRLLHKKLQVQDEKLDQLGQEHAAALEELTQDIDRLRAAQACVESLNATLNRAIESGAVSPDMVDSALKAQLDAIHAERALEKTELAIVQGELENILELGQQDLDDQSGDESFKG